MHGRIHWLLISALTLVSVFGALLLPNAPIHAQYEDVIARAKPAVVLVSVKHTLGGAGRGSGFVYDPSGFILTNHHVVEGAAEIVVTLPDRRSFPASVVDYVRRQEYTGSDVRAEIQTIIDAAVLKINAQALPTLPFGDSSIVRQGQEVLVAGYPGGVTTDEVSVTRGIVSALRPGWIQTDAAIEKGNSGGPVIDRQGNVVGLATFVTGPLRKIGGVVAINNLRELTASALNPGTQRYQELSVPGLEYALPINVGRRKTYRDVHRPGTTGGQVTAREAITEVSQAQSFHGAWAYVVRTNDGTEARHYLDSGGLVTLGATGRWIVSHSEPNLIWPVPPLLATSWQNRWRAQNPSDGIVALLVIDLKIDAANEVISVPAGTFSQVIRVAEVSQELVTRGTQRQTRRLIGTQWWAPRAGLILRRSEVAETQELFVRELLSSSP